MGPFLCLASEGAIASRNSYREFGGCEFLWILRCPIVFGLCLPAVFVDHPGDREIMLPIHELPTAAFALQHLRLELNTEAWTLHSHWTGEVLNADALLSFIGRRVSGVRVNIIGSVGETDCGGSADLVLLAGMHTARRACECMHCRALFACWCPDANWA